MIGIANIYDDDDDGDEENEINPRLPSVLQYNSPRLAIDTGKFSIRASAESAIAFPLEYGTCS